MRLPGATPPTFELPGSTVHTGQRLLCSIFGRGGHCAVTDERIERCNPTPGSDDPCIARPSAMFVTALEHHVCMKAMACHANNPGSGPLYSRTSGPDGFWSDGRARSVRMVPMLGLASGSLVARMHQKPCMKTAPGNWARGAHVRLFLPSSSLEIVQTTSDGFWPNQVAQYLTQERKEPSVTRDDSCLPGSAPPKFPITRCSA